LYARLAVFGLHQRQPAAERAARTALEARDGLLGAAGRDQLARDRGGQRLARLALPDHDPAARILARPAREPLAVLDDVVAADRARAEVGARDADVLERGVERLDGLAGEQRDVAHEHLARLLAVLDLAQARLPVAGQRRRGQRMLAQQADHVEALLGRHQRAALALDVLDVDEALDDRGARGGRADARVLHRLAQLVVVAEAVPGLPRRQQRRVRVAAGRLGDLLLRGDVLGVDGLAALELGKRLRAA